MKNIVSEVANKIKSLIQRIFNIASDLILYAQHKSIFKKTFMFLLLSELVGTLSEVLIETIGWENNIHGKYVQKMFNANFFRLVFY